MQNFITITIMYISFLSEVERTGNLESHVLLFFIYLHVTVGQVSVSIIRIFYLYNTFRLSYTSLHFHGDLLVSGFDLSRGSAKVKNLQFSAGQYDKRDDIYTSIEPILPLFVLIGSGEIALSYGVLYFSVGKVVHELLRGKEIGAVRGTGWDSFQGLFLENRSAMLL